MHDGMGSPSITLWLTPALADLVLHDTYIVWGWEVPFILLVVIVVLILGAAALIKYLLFR